MHPFHRLNCSNMATMLLIAPNSQSWLSGINSSSITTTSKRRKRSHIKHLVYENSSFTALLTRSIPKVQNLPSDPQEKFPVSSLRARYFLFPPLVRTTWILLGPNCIATYEIEDQRSTFLHSPTGVDDRYTTHSWTPHYENDILYAYLSTRWWTAQLKFSFLSNWYSFSTGGTAFMPTVTRYTCKLNGNTLVPYLVFLRGSPIREQSTTIEVDVYTHPWPTNVRPSHSKERM